MKTKQHLGDKLTLDITDLTARGEGVAHADGMTVFVDGALPGDTVRAQVTTVKQQYLKAKTLETLTQSNDRQASPCAYFPTCGGCQWLHLKPEATLSRKRNIVVNALKHIGGIADADALVRPAIGMDTPARYRNKAQWKIDAKSRCLGFYAKGSHDVVPVADCLNMDAAGASVIKTIDRFLAREKIDIYDEQTGQGNLRGFLVRTNKAGDIMLVPIVRTMKGTDWQQAARYFKKALPNLKAFLVNENTTRGNRVLGKKTTRVWGDDVLTEILLGYRFRVSPASFFQVNPYQTEKLYAKAITYAGLTGNETVYDLYCGTGTIGLCASGKAKRIIGVEIVADAVADAKRNAKANGVTNAAFYCGRAEDIVPKRVAAGERPDVVIVDPPRKGCAKTLIETIIACGTAKLVYVSCNPATLARDAAFLTQAGFTLEEATPVDMFPGTGHVETVALMSRRKD